MRLWRALVVAAVVLATAVSAAPARAGTAFVVLQMNLCDSGVPPASCYTFGRSVDEAAGKIHRYPPELVTLQEVCHNDVTRLSRTMAAAAFFPAWNRDTHDRYRCTNGELYGIALLHHGNGRAVYHGWYANQDASEEVRAWLCATVVNGQLTACTTHLSTHPDVAVRQCHELMSILASRWVLPEVVVAGDFNLTTDCAPPGYDRRTDGSLQQVYFTRNVHSATGWHERMRWTDHPLLVERLRI